MVQAGGGCGLDGEDYQARVVSGPPWAESARRRGATRGQAACVLISALVVAAVIVTFPHYVWDGAVVATWVAFSAAAAWRLLLILAARRPSASLPAATPDALLPRYTVIAALYHEAAILPQLVQRLSRLDYPVDRLQAFIALEADDAETLAAARALNLPTWMSILVVPAGEPRTKPRALNHALNRATGEFVTVYDAEDAPHPGQLREAVARFRSGDADLACLQAPLHIRSRGARDAFLDRQFTAEYAALFEVVLPGLARLGLPFPLGGTSNHFRVAALRDAGGWDAWNVTEDADLGFRLWRRGHSLGVLRLPTLETPPGPLERWLPQRTRWIKGYMQTWGVHMRRPWRLGLRGFLALQMTLGLGVVSAAIHALTLAWVLVLALAAATKGLTPATPPVAVAVLAAGVLTAWASCWIGARRVGAPYGLRDAISAPIYWSLQTLAFVQACWRLVWQPFVWDKTPHEPDPAPKSPAGAGRRTA